MVKNILNNKYLPIISTFLFILAFTIHPHTDSDLGWHLRYGQYFFDTGSVLKDNILTYVWPDYKWVQASWGYDILAFFIFTAFGFAGLSITGGLITLLIFTLITWPQTRFKFWQLFALATIFISQTPPLYFTGMRTQTPSSVFFAIVIIISYMTLCRPKENSFISQKAYLFLPLIFLLWANMHGGFALGLGLISLMWIVSGGLILIKRILKKHFDIHNFKKWVLFGGITITSFITPLINPWGTRIYEESFKHSSNTNLNHITEWRPTIVDYPQELTISLILLLIAIIIFLVRRKISDLPFLAALLFTFLLATEAVRFIINAGILLTYFLALNIPELKFKITQKKAFAYVAVFIIASLVLIDMGATRRYFWFVPLGKIINFNWTNYCNDLAQCDENITYILQDELPKGNGYNPYGYGGYLEWRVPQLKAFMDGRMAAWEENGKTPPVADGDNVFLDRSPASFIRFNSIYNFEWVIIPSHAGAARYLDALSKNGQWEKVYQGPTYSYYVKVKKS